MAPIPEKDNNDHESIVLEPLGQYLFDDQIIDNFRDKIFLTEGLTGKQITFGQLEQQTHSLAKSMISLLGIESNDICAIMGDNSIQNCIVICACLLLNIPYTSISPVFTHFYLGQQLNQTEAKYLFISRKHYPKIERLFKQDDNCQLKKRLKVIVFDNNDPLENPITDCSNFEKLIDAFQDVKIETIPYFSKSIDSTVTIVFTSGTTGKPKGACHTHRSIMNNLINLKRFEPLKLYHRLSTLLLLPVTHLSGNSLFFFLMATQTPIVLFDYSQIDSVFEIIEKYKIVQIYGTSNAMNTLVKNHEGHDISSIRLAMTGGTKLAESTANILFYDLGIKILDAYGSTECIFISANNRLDRIPDNVGKVLGCYQMKLIDLVTKDTITLPGKSGEICITGSSLFREYFNNPEETKLAIDDEGWFHTGDVGQLDEEGNLKIVDRIKELIKFKHFSVFPADIECCLMSHSAVKEIVVVPVKHREYYQVPRAYVIFKNDQISIKELEEFANENLGIHQQLLGGLIQINDKHLKSTSMGKVDRQYYKRLCADEILD
uniref:4-coumarate--CoA ligase 2-like n=1 Tax=Dermatophagoides pteronyssinus TaxID=6956 RepID=A0A6P6YKL0_DERPT|nr:4-coumarate--CoA ligase 2-like [Dermatophagoides pteronyssinus]